MTDKTDSGKQSNPAENGLVDKVCSVWRSVSPVCTSEEVDRWNRMLKWRGIDLALITEGMYSICVTVKRKVDGCSAAARIIQISSIDNTDAGGKQFAEFSNKVAYLEAILRMWPDTGFDAAGNILLKVGNGEYGRVEPCISELRYAVITSYDDKRQKGTWGYVDLKNLMAYTVSITQQIENRESREMMDDLDSLMEL